MLTPSSLAAISAEDLAEYWFVVRNEAYLEMMKAFEHRKAQGFNQDTIAARLCKNKSQISRQLRGQTNLTLRSISDLLRALDYRLQITATPLETLPLSNDRYEDSPERLMMTQGTGANVTIGDGTPEIETTASPQANRMAFADAAD